MDIETIQKVFVQAIASDSFTRHGSRMGTWDISRGCESPKPRTLYSRQTGRLKAIRTRSVPAGIELVLLTPCRRCQTCLKRHARLWRERAIIEIDQSERTWFGTLTLSPAEHTRVDHLAATACRDFWGLSPDKKFAARKKVIGREITLYLKRLREAAGVRFRYLCVYEVHDGEDTSDFMRGRPHVHLLLHEFAGQPIRKRILDDQWRLGFSKWKLTYGDQAAWYASKYISKAIDARVRASQWYGNLEHSLE